jgi:hypothetical protein
MADILPGKRTGLIPRDYKSHPPGYLACAPVAADDWLVPESEWADRLADQQANKTSLWDLREAHYDVLKSLDQNGYGLCWAFSSTKATMYTRVRMNEPGLVLSAWYVAGKINGWRDEGGWGASSLEFISKTGIPTMDKCPKYSSGSVASDAEQNAGLHKVPEWWDGTEDRDQNRAIMISAFLLGLAPVIDLNWLSHSMAGCCLKSIDPLEVWCDNSWGDVDQYGPKGIYTLKGSKAIPDSIVVPRVTLPSVV